MPRNTPDPASNAAITTSSAAILDGWALNPAQQRFWPPRRASASTSAALARARPRRAPSVPSPARSITRLARPHRRAHLSHAARRHPAHLLRAAARGDASTATTKSRALTLPNGSEVLFRSLDEPDRVRGLNLAWFWLDEAPLCGYYAWQILKARLRQRGYATAGWATGTPKGRDGFARDFELTPRPAHALYRAATSANAAHLPPDYIDDLGLSGALYDQEVLGLFTAFEGLVYAFAADLTEATSMSQRQTSASPGSSAGSIGATPTPPPPSSSASMATTAPGSSTSGTSGAPRSMPSCCPRWSTSRSATASRRGTAAPTSRSTSPRCRPPCSGRASRVARCPPRMRCAPASRPSRASWAGAVTARAASTSRRAASTPSPNTAGTSIPPTHGGHVLAPLSS